MIAIQMDPGEQSRWGGAKTLDKARLYLTLDKSKMTIVKAKNWASELNLYGLSRSFKLIGGSRFKWDKWERAW